MNRPETTPYIDRDLSWLAFNHRVLREEIIHHRHEKRIAFIPPRINRQNFRARDAWNQVRQFDADSSDEPTVNPTVKRIARRVPVRIRTNPAVEVIRRVQRLRDVADEMSHDAHDVDRVGPGIRDFLRRTILLEGFEV